MKENIVKEKSELFAVRIIKLYKYLCDAKKEFVLSNQLLRSGTSIGANIAESKFAASKNDFISKLQIALKECSETEYWLRLLYSTNYINNKEYQSIISDCSELMKLLIAITRSVKKK